MLPDTPNQQAPQSLSSKERKMFVEDSERLIRVGHFGRGLSENLSKLNQSHISLETKIKECRDWIVNKATIPQKLSHEHYFDSDDGLALRIATLLNFGIYYHAITEKQPFLWHQEWDDQEIDRICKTLRRLGKEEYGLQGKLWLRRIAEYCLSVLKIDEGPERELPVSHDRRLQALNSLHQELPIIDYRDRLREDKPEAEDVLLQGRYCYQLGQLISDTNLNLAQEYFTKALRFYELLATGAQPNPLIHNASKTAHVTLKEAEVTQTGKDGGIWSLLMLAEIYLRASQYQRAARVLSPIRFFLLDSENKLALALSQLIEANVIREEAGSDDPKTLNMVLGILKQCREVIQESSNYRLTGRWHYNNALTHIYLAQSFLTPEQVENENKQLLYLKNAEESCDALVANKLNFYHLLGYFANGILHVHKFRIYYKRLREKLNVGAHDPTLTDADEEIWDPGSKANDYSNEREKYETIRQLAESADTAILKAIEQAELAVKGFEKSRHHLQGVQTRCLLAQAIYLGHPNRYSEADEQLEKAQQELQNLIGRHLPNTTESQPTNQLSDLLPGHGDPEFGEGSFSSAQAQIYLFRAIGYVRYSIWRFSQGRWGMGVQMLTSFSNYMEQFEEKCLPRLESGWLKDYYGYLSNYLLPLERKQRVLLLNAQKSTNLITCVAAVCEWYVEAVQAGLIRPKRAEAYLGARFDKIEEVLADIYPKLIRQIEFPGEAKTTGENKPRIIFYPDDPSRESVSEALIREKLDDTKPDALAPDGERRVLFSLYEVLGISGKKIENIRNKGDEKAKSIEVEFRIVDRWREQLGIKESAKKKSKTSSKGRKGR